MKIEWLLMELQRRLDKADKSSPRRLSNATLHKGSLDVYKVVKYDGDIVKVIAWNLTRPEAEQFLTVVHDRMLCINNPNTNGDAYFKIEKHEVTIK